MYIKSFIMKVNSIIITLHLLAFLCNQSNGIDVTKFQQLTKLKGYSKAHINTLKIEGLVKCPQPLPTMSEGAEAAIANATNYLSVLVVKCNVKRFLLTYYPVKYKDIWKECANYGMLPASIETVEEVNCISKKKNEVKDLKASKYKTTFYTAQLDLTLNRSFVSCVTGKEVPPEVWIKEEPDNAFNPEVVAALDTGRQMTKIGLYDLPIDILPTGLVCEIKENVTHVLRVSKKNKNKIQLAPKTEECSAFRTQINGCDVNVIPRKDYTELVQKLDMILKLVKHTSNEDLPDS